jgi:hypothetical protein
MGRALEIEEMFKVIEAVPELRLVFGSSGHGIVICAGYVVISAGDAQRWRWRPTSQSSYRFRSHIREHRQPFFITSCARG